MYPCVSRFISRKGSRETASPPIRSLPQSGGKWRAVDAVPENGRSEVLRMRRIPNLFPTHWGRPVLAAVAGPLVNSQGFDILTSISLSTS